MNAKSNQTRQGHLSIATHPVWQIWHGFQFFLQSLSDIFRVGELFLWIRQRLLKPQDFLTNRKSWQTETKCFKQFRYFRVFLQQLIFPGKAMHRMICFFSILSTLFTCPIYGRCLFFLLRIRSAHLRKVILILKLRQKNDNTPPRPRRVWF